MNSLRCSKCNNIPLIYCKQNNAIHFKCTCSNEGDAYLSNVLSKGEDIKPITTSCAEHSNSFNLYCNDCNMHLCITCKDSHNKHKIIDLVNMRNQIQVESIIEKMNIYKEASENFFSKIKDRLVFRLKMEIQKIENIYKRTSETNVNIINLLEQMLELYNNGNGKYNYQLMSNIRNNTNFVENLEDYALEGELLSEQVMSFVKFCEEKFVIHFPNVPKTPVDPSLSIKLSNMKEIKYIDSMECETVVVLPDGRIAVVPKYKEYVDIYNGTTYHKELTLKGHYKNIESMCYLSNGNIVTATFKDIISIWDTKTGNCIKQIDNLTKNRKIITLTENRLACGSIDGEIRIISSIAPYNIIVRFTETHLGDLNGLIQLKDGRLCSGGGVNDDDISEEMVKFWDLENYTAQEKNTIFNVICYTQENLVELPNKKLLIGGSNEIIVVDLNNYMKEKIIRDQRLGGIYTLIPLKDETILVSSYKNSFHFDSNYDIIKDDKEFKGRIVKKIDDKKFICQYEKKYSLCIAVFEC